MYLSVKEKKNRSTEQNREPRKTPIITLNRSLIKKQKQHNGEKTVFSTNGARTGEPHAKKLRSSALHKN